MEGKFKISDTLGLLKQTFSEWMDDDPFTKAAAVAYYAVFSLPGLLLITLAILGFFLDDIDTTTKMTEELVSFLGEDSRGNIQDILSSIKFQDQSFISSVVGIGTLIFGATGLFIQLQNSLNSIWDVRKKENAGIMDVVKDRFTSLGIVVVVGFLLLMSLVLSTIITIISDWLSTHFGSELVIFSQVANFLLSIGVITVLFAAIFKVLPDVEIKWKMVWLGSLITAVLFTIGKSLISFYMSFSDPSSGFGASGAVILILLWISYSCIIVFFGAEFTQVYARKYGYHIKPSKHAEKVIRYEQKEHEEPKKL